MRNKILFLLLFLASSTYLSAEQIPFEGESIEIVGEFASLNVNEGKLHELDIKYQGSTHKSEAYEIITGDKLTIIKLKEKSIFYISVPIGTNVSCKPIEIASEDGWYQNQHNYKISLTDLKGEVIIETDGYDINLVDIMGPTSVVTYGDIKAVYNKAPVSEMISLDTYQGSILVQIPGSHEFFADQVVFDQEKKIFVTNKAEVKFSNEECTMKLHTESGNFVFIQPITEPTHPELQDKLIKLFIRDQGKKGMATGAREALNELGYKDYIDQMPDTRKFTGNTLAEELVILIDEYGFPTTEMVGDGYAMKGVAIVLFNSSPQYMDKYKTEFAKHFGQHLLDIYYKRGNGRSNK